MNKVRAVALNQKGLAPILIIILVAATALGGYFIYQNQSKSTPSLQPTTQPSPSPTDETANWKTYTNPQGEYSFKYPANMKIESDIDYPTEVTFYFPQDQNREFFDYIMVGVTTIPTGITIPQAVQKGYSVVGSYIETKFENVTIDGINGLANQAPAALDAYDIHLIKNRKLFAFRVSATDVSISSEQRKIFEKMLSTFKFTQ